MKDYVEHYGRKCITCGYWRRGYLHRGDDLKVFEQRVNKCGCHGMNNPRYYNDEDLSAFDSCEFWIKEPNVLSKEEIDQEVQAAAEREKKIKNSSERAFSGGILRKEKQERQEAKQQKPVMIIIGASIIFVIIVGFILKNVSTEKNSPAVTHPNTITADSTNVKSVYKEALVRIEGGNFNMGSDDGGDDARPAHMVTLKSFSIGKYPVTQKEYEEVMGYNPSNFKGQNRPVESVSWYDAVEYCNKLSEKEGLTPAYTIDKSRQDYNNTNDDDNMKWVVIWNRSANGYRLPTEAEWEYAAKGGKGSPGNFKYSGSDNINEVAWHKHNSGGTSHDVGIKKPNNLGLYDMSGNVDEWCWDWYDKYYYANSPSSDPVGASSGEHRVARGGTWNHSAELAGTTFRNYGRPSLLKHFDGFRVVRN